MIDDLFTYRLIWKKNSPKFEILLKRNKPRLCRPNSNISYSPSELKYFQHYLDDDILAKEAYDFRRKFYKKTFAFQYFKEHDLLDEQSIQKIEEWFIKIDKKMHDNHAAALAKPSWHENQRISKIESGKKHSARLKAEWASVEGREKWMQVLHNEQSKEKRVQSFLKTINENKEAYVASMNTSERLQKISEASRKAHLERVRLGLPTGFPKFSAAASKCHIVNDYKMNGLEAIIANILNEQSYSWVYEPKIDLGFRIAIPDFCINDKIIIECYGDYWHANPLYYKEDEIVIKPRTAIQIWENDLKRIDALKQKFKHVLIYWETEIKDLSFKEKLQQDLQEII